MKKNQYTTCIIEDEPVPRQALAEALSESQYFDNLGEAGTYDEGLKLIQSKKPEVVFLDIKLGNGDAFQMIKKLESEGVEVPIIILNTAYSEYELAQTAINEYKKHIAYLLKKPFWNKWEEQELAIVDKIEEHRNYLSPRVKFSSEKFSISKEYQTFYMNYSDIKYIEVPKTSKDEPKSKGKILVSTLEDNYEINGSLRKILNDLPPYFKQISRVCIVNTKYVKMADRAKLVLLLENVTNRFFYIGESYKTDLFRYLDR